VKPIEFDVSKSNADLDIYLSEQEIISGKITRKEVIECISEFKNSIVLATTIRNKIPVNTFMKTESGLDGLMLDMGPLKNLVSLFQSAVFTEDQELIDSLVDELHSIHKTKRVSFVKYHFIRGSIIRSVFNEINNSEKFRIDCFEAFKNISNGMSLKMSYFLSSLFFNPDLAVTLLNRIVEKQKKRQNKNEVAIQDEEDFIFKQALEFAAKLKLEYGSKKDDLKFIKDTILGDHPVIFIQEIYHRYLIDIKSHSEKEKNIAFYPLLKLIEFDRNYYDFQEFQNSEKVKKFDSLESKKRKFERYIDKEVINYLALKK